MPLANFLPNLPLNWINILIVVVGLLGALLLGYGVYLEAEKSQDAVFVIGSACLLVYAIAIYNAVFIIAMTILFLTAGREFIQIIRGKHTHSTSAQKS